VSLQMRGKLFCANVCFHLDLYWCHECVSSISADTYHRSNKQCLLIAHKSCIWLHDWLMQFFLVIDPVMHSGYLPVPPAIPLTPTSLSDCSNSSFDVLDFHSRLELWEGELWELLVLLWTGMTTAHSFVNEWIQSQRSPV
jgi:hypothetical protein